MKRNEVFVFSSVRVHPQLTLCYFRSVLPVGGVRAHRVSCRTVLVRFSGSGAADKWTVRIAVSSARPAAALYRAAGREASFPWRPHQLRHAH